MATTEERFNAAMKAAQDVGVFVYPNYDSCCRSCTFHSLDKVHGDQDYVFFYKGQGNELVFRDGEPYFAEEMYADDFEDFNEEDGLPGYSLQEVFRKAQQLFWYFNETEAAQTLFNAFVHEGFNVEWDGSQFTAVKVVFS